MKDGPFNNVWPIIETFTNICYIDINIDEFVFVCAALNLDRAAQ